MFLLAGIVISMTRDTFEPGLFYAMIGGIIIIVIYASMKSRKEQKEKRRLNRRSKK
jgi:hypothetical protein